MPRLAELAIASLGDPDAAVVLGDWVLENKWFDARVMPLLGRPKKWKAYSRVADNRRALHRWAAEATPEWALAIAAVVLFGDWPDTAYEVRFGGASHLYHWPVVSRCWVRSMADQFEHVRRLVLHEFITPSQALGIFDMPSLNDAIDRDIDAQAAHIERLRQAASSGSDPR